MIARKEQDLVKTNPDGKEVKEENVESMDDPTPGLSNACIQLVNVG